MARRTNTFLLATLMLSIGLALGGHLNTLRIHQQANAVSPRDASFGTVEPLVQSGEHISRISSSAMPAAVHIQATRRESDGRRVEETDPVSSCEAPRSRACLS